MFFFNYKQKLRLKSYEYCLFVVAVFISSESLMIGEVFVDGQKRDVWCNSKKPITDLNMYSDASSLTNPYYATIPSCYLLINLLGTPYSVKIAIANPSNCLNLFSGVSSFVCE
jgi:hypothetical protein